MTILSVRLIGDPVLGTPAAEVTDFGPGLARLIENMMETMIDVDGVGLAAPQIGVSLQIFTFSIEGVEGHIVNPVLDVRDGSQTEDGDEGCLSVPELFSNVRRARWARVAGKDMRGNDVAVEGTGMLARVLQHETDHLRGMLYVDRLEGVHRKNILQALRSSDYKNVAAQAAMERSQSLNSSFIRVN